MNFIEEIIESGDKKNLKFRFSGEKYSWFRKWRHKVRIVFDAYKK